MMVSFEVANHDPDAIYTRLPLAGWFEDREAARWLVRSRGGIDITLSGGFAPEEHEDGGFGLGPHERRAMLVDLAAFEPPLAAGQYQIQVAYPVQGEFVPSPWVPMLVVQPTKVDAAFAAHMLSDSSSATNKTWGSFFTPASTTPAAAGPGVSPRARQATALHLFVHQALYGTKALADIDIGNLDRIQGQPLDGEREVLRYELLAERKAAQAAEVRDKIATTWPALRWRLEKVDAGLGFLRLKREWLRGAGVPTP